MNSLRFASQGCENDLREIKLSHESFVTRIYMGDEGNQFLKMFVRSAWCHVEGLSCSFETAKLDPILLLISFGVSSNLRLK